MRHRFYCLILGVSLFSLTGCLSSLNDSDDTTNTDFAAAVSEVGDAVGAGATGLGRSEPHHEEDDLMRASSEGASAATLKNLRASCSSISFGSCSAGQKIRYFSDEGGNSSPCTRGKSNGRRVYGASVLTFSDAICAFDSLGAGATVTRTLSNHYIQRGLRGNKVLIYTGTGTVSDQIFVESDLEDYEGTSRSGGTTLKRTAGDSDKLTISGIHRRGFTTAGKFTFWHTIFSDPDALTVTKSGSGDSRTASLTGTLFIMHNRMRKKVTKTLSNVTFTKGCAHPTSGTATLSIPSDDGTTSSTVTITYSNTCGEASINGIKSTLDAES